jgi:hypothetical protein
MKSCSRAGQVDRAVTVDRRHNCAGAMQSLAREMKLGLGKPKPKRAGYDSPTL